MQQPESRVCPGFAGRPDATKIGSASIADPETHNGDVVIGRGSFISQVSEKDHLMGHFSMPMLVTDFFLEGFFRIQMAKIMGPESMSDMWLFAMETMLPQVTS